jgi:hypothetical protein
MPQPLIKESNGVIKATGALQKPRTPAEDKYMLAKTFAPGKAANLNIPVSINQYRPDIFYQLNIGSCAQCSSAGAAFTSRNSARALKGQSLDAKMPHPGYMYELARRRRNWWDEDTGSIVSDGLDILRADTPLLERHEYVDNASFDYPDSVFEDGKTIDYIASHRAFFVDEGNALEQLWLAIDAGMAVVISMYWPDEYFYPERHGGKLPEGITWSPNGPAHAIYITQIVPDVQCAGSPNSWSEGWNRNVAKMLGSQFRPGEVGIPYSFFQPGKNSPIFELRAVSPEPVIVPEPQPEPEPQPPQPAPTDIRARIITAAEKEAKAIAALDVGRNKHKWMDNATGRMVEAIKNVN